MMIHEIAIQGPQNKASVLRSIQQIAPMAKFNRVTGLFAYATKSGVDLLIEVLSQHMRNWDEVSKRWLISIDFARTEPAALKRLISLGNSEVRVPYFDEVMERNFNPLTCFHAKTLILDTNSDYRIGPFGLVVGSANLTVSGLSFGHENALSIMWKKKPPKAFRRYFYSFFEELRQIEILFDLAPVLDQAMIQRYAMKRPKIKRLKSEDDSPQVKRLRGKKSEVTMVKAVALSTGRNLVVDVKYVVQNRGKGLPGNQIDLQRGTRVFFGFGVGQVPPNTPLGSVKIKYRNHSVDCRLRFGNNSMDKLNLPRPGIEGPLNYSNKTLLFTRQSDGSFLLKVGTPREIRGWKKTSRLQGTFYEMQGGREYGVFS